LATVIHKIGIAGEFVMLFNKFDPMMARTRALHGCGANGIPGQQKAPEGVMARKKIAHSVRGDAPGFLADCAGLLQGALRDLLDPYRPEQHYMRGPGPKWHAKHDGAPADFGMMAGLVRVHVKR
jgi:hypothetical protein